MRPSWGKLFPYRRREAETLAEKVARLRGEYAALREAQRPQQSFDFTEPRRDYE